MEAAAGSPIPVQEQHDFLELAKDFEWDAVRETLDASPVWSWESLVRTGLAREA